MLFRGICDWVSLGQIDPIKQKIGLTVTLLNKNKLNPTPPNLTLANLI